MSLSLGGHFFLKRVSNTYNWFSNSIISSLAAGLKAAQLKIRK
jgi:hypothetical protein